jgi:hypothetical protein
MIEKLPKNIFFIQINFSFIYSYSEIAYSNVTISIISSTPPLQISDLAKRKNSKNNFLNSSISNHS